MALEYLGVASHWRIAIPAAACHRVAAAVLHVGATPVIVENDADLLLTAEAIAGHIGGLHAVIAVHQYGLPCDAALLREVLGPTIPIVEDAAPAFRVTLPAERVDGNANLVVTSFGSSKPLSIGGGGAVFADGPIDATIDVWSPRQRIRATPARSIALSIHALPHIGPAVVRAESVTNSLRHQVPGLLDELCGLGLAPWQPATLVQPSWGFVPIRMENAEQFKRLRHAPEAEALGVCAPVEMPLRETPMLRGRAEVVLGPRPPRSLHESWILLDPVAALRAPQALERWARRGA